jgi:hypothetical protein
MKQISVGQDMCVFAHQGYEGIKRYSFVLLALLLLNIAPSYAQSSDASFLDDDEFVATDDALNNDVVTLPNLLELRKNQQQSTDEFNIMLLDIVADLNGAEDLTYEKPVMKSLFFNLMEYALIQEARRGFEARLPGTSRASTQSRSREIRARRDLMLGGILYTSDDSWSVYLNEIRITPNNLPEEIIDIQVHSDFIRLKWFDKGTNTIFPVRLRPNQRFNLDARLFFPG